MTLLTQALDTIGWLSNPPEMPCYSWGIPSTSCITGSKLRANEPRSPCASCYAQRGHYCRPVAIAARERRLAIIQQAMVNPTSNQSFVTAFAYVLNHRLEHDKSQGRKDHRYFRWFDSGDLQSRKHAYIIAAIVRQTPNVSHWLPTREPDFIDKVTWPDNMTVRLSSNIIDEDRPQDYDGWHWPTAALHTKPGELPNDRYIECQSKLLGAYICQTCRDCWNPDLDISYLKR